MVNKLIYPSGSTLTVTDPTTFREVNGYFYDHSVCTRSGNAVSGYTYTPATALVRIVTPDRQVGDVNNDGFVNALDIPALALAIANHSTDTAICDVNGDSQVSLADLTTLVNTLKNRKIEE